MVLPTPNVPRVRVLVTDITKSKIPSWMHLVCFQPCQRRAALPCDAKDVHPNQFIVVLVKGHLAHALWISTCMVGTATLLKVV